MFFGLPGSFAGLGPTDEVSGCSPCRAATIAGAKGVRFPGESKLAGTRFQVRHVAATAKQRAGSSRG